MCLNLAVGLIPLGSAIFFSADVSLIGKLSNGVVFFPWSIFTVHTNLNRIKLFEKGRLMAFIPPNLFATSYHHQLVLCKNCYGNNGSYCSRLAYWYSFMFQLSFFPAYYHKIESSYLSSPISHLLLAEYLSRSFAIQHSWIYTQKMSNSFSIASTTEHLLSTWRPLLWSPAPVGIISCTNLHEKILTFGITCADQIILQTLSLWSWQKTSFPKTLLAT